MAKKRSHANRQANQAGQTNRSQSPQSSARKAAGKGTATPARTNAPDATGITSITDTTTTAAVTDDSEVSSSATSATPLASGNDNSNDNSGGALIINGRVVGSGKGNSGNTGGNGSSSGSGSGSNNGNGRQATTAASGTRNASRATSASGGASASRASTSNASRANASNANQRAAQQRTTQRTTQRTAQRGTSSDTSSQRLADLRARNAQQRAQAQRRYARQNSWWRRNWPLLATVITVLLLIGIFITLANRNNGNTAGIGDVAPASLVNQVTGVPTTVLDQVGTGAITTTSLQAQANTPVLKDSNGKPIFFYYGTEWCPNCAVERWSMIVALSRFGTFSNLHQMRSANDDGNIATFDFDGSTYTSQYITFQPLEIEDRDHNSIATPTSDQQTILTKYNVQGFPFLSIADQYTQSNAGVNYSVISGLSWTDIGSKLSNGSDPVTQNIVGEANYLTAAICQVTDQAPDTVCKSTTIQQIEAKLPKGS